MATWVEDAIIPGLLLGVMLYNFLAWVHNLAVMVLWHRMAIMLATVARMGVA